MPQDQESHSISHFLKSALKHSKIAVGPIVESKPPNITRGIGEVRNLRLTPATTSPVAAAARTDTEIRKRLEEMPGIIPFKITKRFTHANA